MAQELEHVFTPKEASETFDLGPSLIRRYSGIYEKKLGGTVGKDRRGGRLYPRWLLEAFVETRQRTGAGETAEEALRAAILAAEKDVQTALSTSSAKDPTSLLEQVLSVNQRLAERVNNLEVQLAAMREENARMYRVLETPKDDSVAPQLQEILELNRALVGQIMGPEEPNEMTELRRMNEYLLGELERRRREEGEKPKRRPWWRFWRRR